MPAEGLALGNDPETGLPVTRHDGRFGPYLQLGQAEDGEKPKRASIPKGYEPAEIDLERTKIRSPIDGVVIERAVDQGDDPLDGLGLLGQENLAHAAFAEAADQAVGADGLARSLSGHVHASPFVGGEGAVGIGGVARISAGVVAHRNPLDCSKEGRWEWSRN